MRVLGLDRDPDAVALARERLAEFGERVRLVRRLRRAPAVVAAEGRPPGRRRMLDLGVSSMQLDRPERGFAFRTTAPSTCAWTRPGARPRASCWSGSTRASSPRSCVSSAKSGTRAAWPGRSWPPASRRPAPGPRELAELIAAEVPARQARQARRIHPTRSFRRCAWRPEPRELEQAESGVRGIHELLAPGANCA
ncbi:MAG: 16S rRNA (cytosine(1402)-N(4))-methyltransferase [Planctomycetota bacterium]